MLALKRASSKKMLLYAVVLLVLAGATIMVLYRDASSRRTTVPPRDSAEQVMPVLDEKLEKDAFTSGGQKETAIFNSAKFKGLRSNPEPDLPAQLGNYNLFIAARK